jgi:very-short-patch-repair endonuclease
MSIDDQDPSASPLSDRILERLRLRPGQKAKEIALALGVDRREVNRCLSHALAGRVIQDDLYAWRLREAPAEKPPEDREGPRSELYRLSRYYLECVGYDTGEGINAFASARDGPPDYAELPGLPQAGGMADWWNAPGAERVLSKIRADSRNLQAWIGFPVRLREHRTSRWHGFFVEPVLLWQVTLPEGPGDAYGLTDDIPSPNFAVLRSFAMGDRSATVEEAARLERELGLNAASDDRPELDELIDRLTRIRPDWDWQEAIDPFKCSVEPPLTEIEKTGIYNRAVILPGKRSPYTLGLEAELAALSNVQEPDFATSALSQWLSGTFAQEGTMSSEPLIEVLPMNTEQREAVRSGLNAAHTVITGPPGTGKSQVVTNLLVNAAWRGQRVLFASKNNKAVDVVEARVNGLGNRPVLLRLGSREYQAKLVEYMTAMLSGHVGEDDRVSYEQGLAQHRELTKQFDQLDLEQQTTLKTRNQVDKLEREAEQLRPTFGRDCFNKLDDDKVEAILALAPRLGSAIDRLHPAKPSVFRKISLRLTRTRREMAVRELMGELSGPASHLGLELPDHSALQEPARLRNCVTEMIDLAYGARKILAYQRCLEALRSCTSFEELSKQRQKLTSDIAENSSRLWRDWVQLTPSRLTKDERKDVADFAALLQVTSGQDANRVNRDARERARVLQNRVASLFSCWAITSLSARGRVPFASGCFDVLVIDEASQCDIASALPLLFRAKRTVIIGDPQQLRHISAVSRPKDADLQSKYGLIESHAAWMYSVNSLYDLAVGVAGTEQIINLRDHHRSHADIIEFSNQAFYGNKLRVATSYAHLKRPSNREAGIIWQHCEGDVTRPGGSSAANPIEARALVASLRDLLISRQYGGTVGVVTPFRAQAQLLQGLIAEDGDLSAIAPARALLIDTVHRFQGDERDVMFFSPVVSRNTPQSVLGFLRSNGNLFNVAITRARGLLQVVGDQFAALDCGIDYLEKFAAYTARLSGEREIADQPSSEQDFGPEYPTVAHPDRVSEWERFFYRVLYKNGIRPIPQYSVEQYDLDFAVIAAGRKLNIEVDGERYHRSWTGELCLRDQLRNQRLIELGWDVKRFWVYEIRDRLPDCVQQVKKWVLSAQEVSE